MIASLIVTLSLLDAIDRSLAHEATSGPALGAASGSLTLDVPYLSQTEALCGGAAVAMVFRYWGDAHAGVEQFAPLVDREAGGIAADALVEAIERRTWRAIRFSGSIETLRAQLSVGRPTVILVEDRPSRYHYLVAIGADERHIVVHDPAWGPSRRIAVVDLLRIWRPANFWSLLILPAERKTSTAAAPPEDPASRTPIAISTGSTTEECQQWLAGGIEQARQHRFEEADAMLEEARSRCHDSPGPLRELAAVRFVEQRWREAAALAQQALARDEHDTYAWDVLASSRFMHEDLGGALRAWNRIGKPRVDAVTIEGLARTRYALLAESLALRPGSLLTEETFRRAERRLQQLPDRTSARIGYHPQADGFATIDVVIAEQATRPHGATEWAAMSAQTAIDRELTVAVPGWTGQGELWSASWRWWTERPRVGLSFATPHVSTLPGVWRVDASWETQTYALSGAPQATIREDRAHGGLTVSDWLTGNVRYEIRTGFDAWKGSRRAVSFGGLLERKLLADRLSVLADATTWAPLAASPGFGSARLGAGFRSSTEPIRVVYAVDGGIERVSAAAPLALWVGAGDGHGRTSLLRAHPLLRDGIITGSMFAQQLAYASGEVRRWIESTRPVQFGVVAFLDLARASRPATPAASAPFQVDVGLGLRVRVPGRDGVLRVDVGHGLHDGARAITFGWQP